MAQMVPGDLMAIIDSMNLTAKNWQFLSRPESYVKASADNGRRLDPNSTPRQFQTARDILARLNGSFRLEPCRGILLADDVGLGKTTVAALVAWVVASAGDKSKVRILVPNDVMMRRWVEELKSHVIPLQTCAPRLNARENRVRTGKVRLTAGSINVAKHSYAAAKENLQCDLLIIDEAHRAKGENSAFSQAIQRQKKNAKRILILTATPFSIRVEELQRMMRLIGGDAAIAAVSSYRRALDALYSGNTLRATDDVAKELATKANAAVDALSNYVIRHGVDDLPHEKAAFGTCEDWKIDVPPASPAELELLMRMDRAMRTAKNAGALTLKATNDPRFHVGWRHFDSVRQNLAIESKRFNTPTKSVIELHSKVIGALRRNILVHPKLAAVAEEVRRVVAQGEKVVLFCHHHATAQELTVILDNDLPKHPMVRSSERETWKKAWTALLDVCDTKAPDTRLPYIATFIDWLCADMMRSQTQEWIQGRPVSVARLIQDLQIAKGRGVSGDESIFEAARNLYQKFIKSKSSSAVLALAEDQPESPHLPGADGTSRVIGVCDPSLNRSEGALFIHNNQPDTVIAIFNSPFGPDVLVTTDKLSEGIDLHRYCRHLVHFELDPSPIRTVQRNGRLRRVNSWAAVSEQPIRIAYPAFPGTRDHQLVKIMKKRVDNFSLLLGGVKEIDLEQIGGADESWRNEVIAKAKNTLVLSGSKLRARK